MIRVCIVLFFILSLLPVQSSSAQAHPAWFERGVAALEEQRYDDAEDAFRWIIEREPENAQVRYLLASVLLAKGDEKAADQSIVRALKIEPENLTFLEFQLEVGFPREPLEIIRRVRRDELAAKILLMDSLSVLPNIQLGEGMMNEWLEWRGRITIEDIEILPGARRANQTQNMTASRADPTQNAGARGRLGPADIFDVADQAATGGNVVTLNPRAEDAYPKAEAFLKRALVRDSENQRAHLHLARLYTTLPDIPALDDLAQSYQKQAHKDHYAWLLKGYAQHLLGNEGAADEQFSTALYMMPDSVRSVFLDTDRLLNKEGLKQKKETENFTYEKFWSFRDPRLLTPQNERLIEHFARLVYADLHFSEPKLNLQGWDSERGEVYIRYGKPDKEFYMANAVANCGAATYDRFHIFEYKAFRFVFGNLWPQLNQYIFYSPCSQVYQHDAAMGVQIDQVIQAKENIREMAESYDFDAAGKRVAFPFLTSSFKGKQGAVDLFVPYGIPVAFSALELTQTLGLHAGAFLLSEADGIEVEQRSNVRDIKVKDITTFKESALWLDTHHLVAKPGAYELSVEFETEQKAGAGFYRTKIDIPDFYSEHLQLSDLLLAYSVGEAGPEIHPAQVPAGLLFRDDLLIKPAPWGVFSKEQPLYLYFEIYNLKTNQENSAHFEVETVLLPYQNEKGLPKIVKQAFRRRAKEGVSVRFERTSAPSDVGQYLILETQDQPAGKYIVVMRVTDQISKKMVETQRMVLLE